MNEPDFIEIPYKRPSSKKIKQIGTMTQYEYTRLLECRAKQIAAGMPYFIEWADVFDPIAIAKQEIIERKTNLIIVRKMPDLTQPSGFRDEIWDPKDMNIYDS
jgi:DNA-directed RNA polymerase subunit K/omega